MNDGEDMTRYERTFSMIKPDATARNITGRVNAYFEDNGLRIVAQKRLRLTLQQAEHFYVEHRQRPFFKDLCVFMSSGAVVVQVLEGEEAVVRTRRLMGSTDPAEAETGTIRATFGTSIQENVVHGSDSLETAQREIQFFFSTIELLE